MKGSNDTKISLNKETYTLDALSPDFAIRIAEDTPELKAGDFALAIAQNNVFPGELAVIEYPGGEHTICRLHDVGGVHVFAQLGEMQHPLIIAANALVKVIGKVVGVQFQ